MKLSRRITQVTDGGSGGWDIYFKARAMKQAGAPVIELTVGDHDIPTHPDILGAMDASARAGATGYSAVPGSERLRAAIAARCTEMTGVETRVQDVIVTAGGQAALLAAHAAALDPGDTGLFIDPYYATYPGTIRAVAGVPKAIAARPEGGFQPRASAIDAAAAGARSLLINSPNNPTGAVYSRRTMHQIAEIATAHDLWLISDEVYDSQVWQGTHVSARALDGMAERTLVIGSMSKAFAMTGSRIGWIIAAPEVIRWLTILATHTTYGVPGFVQDAALYALENRTRLEPLVAAPYLRRRDLAMRVFSQSPALHPAAPQGAMYVMLDVRPTGLDGIGFADALLEDTGIAVMPGESFGAAAAGHIRIALTQPEGRLETALRQIRAFAEALLGRRGGAA
ncbi:MAG: aminotransferase class I/II-fold pyridoxal phosphate-dependent enzyme [Rhodobacteraceae bacterium]|nr:aminotransferase class I/II-fold pyridoxal phosphate-dependent enzyme [Paracoccaceae bacterium]